MKKLLSILAVLSLLLGLAPFAIAEEDACFHRYDGDVSFTMCKKIVAGDSTLPENDTVADNAYTRMFEYATGVHPDIVWYASGDAYDQKVSMAIATGDIPDYMEVNQTQFRMLAKAGLIADLTDVFEQYACPQWKNDYAQGNNVALKVATYGDRLMGIPSQSAVGDCASMLWIRTDWLDKLGLEVPKTVEDIAQVALAFKEKDPDGNGINDTVGLYISASGYDATSTDIGNIGDFFANFGAYPHMWIKDDAGKIQYGSLMDGAVNALEVLNDWYKRGVIIPDFASNPDSSQIASGKCGMFFGPWWASWSPLSDAGVNDPSSVWVSYGLPLSEDGNFRAGMINPGQTIGVISAKMEHPEMILQAFNIMRYIPYSERDEKYVELSDATDKLAHCYSIFRVLMVPVTEIESICTAIQAYHNGETTFEKITEEMNAQNLDPSATISAIEYALIVDKDMYGDIGAYGNSYGYSVGAYPMTLDNYVRVYNDYFGITPTMEQNSAYLQKLESDAYTKMILGDTNGKTISEFFAQFVKTYLEQGGQTILDEVQAELDASK